MDEEALAMAAAEHGEGSGGGAEDGHLLDLGRGAADEAGGFGGFGQVLRRDDDAGQAAERRHGGVAAGFRLGGIEAFGVAADESADDGSGGPAGLDEDAARRLTPAGAAGNLHDLPAAAPGRAKNAAGEAEDGGDDPPQREGGEGGARGG